MSYHILVQFDVLAGKHENFKRASLLDARDSLKDEPGTLRFEIIHDENNLNRFFLYETYESEDAFHQHCSNPAFKTFLETIERYASAPTFLLKGYRVE